MEPIQKTPGTIKGVEVLFFDEAEIRKMKGDNASWAAIGPLSVLYFKDYNRFVLHLNDWRYPLMRRLPITASGKNDPSNRVYSLLAVNGFCYELRINKSSANEAVSNLETIFANNSGFSWEGEAPSKKLEASPDDKLTRAALNVHKDTGLKEVISQAISQATESIKHVAKSLKPGSKATTSTKKRMNLAEIKTKDFKKDAHSTFKKNFFETQGKASQEFLSRRRENPNLTHAADFSELLKTSDSKAPVLYLHKEEVEEAILNNKDVLKTGLIV
jgi:hypothetical protein